MSSRYKHEKMMVTSLLPLLSLNSRNSIFAKLLTLAQTRSTRVQEADFLVLALRISSDSQRELQTPLVYHSANWSPQGLITRNMLHRNSDSHKPYDGVLWWILSKS